ncbi:MAG: L-alanine-DL-glutamate epimerase-like enolase superfamily enzyme [Candidatus Latescibacterota bacterium]|jgi:L-alanine-DL-glutamate epimerase-like enolase superfamily enzyme
MKITDIRVFPVAQFVYVKIVVDEGLYGLGEASLSGRTLAVVEALNTIKPLLIGQDATRIEFIWQDIFRGSFWRGGPVLQSALAGIDIALWDLAGKALGVPTYRLLGGAARDRVLVYRHVRCNDIPSMIEHGRTLLDEGYKVLRMSPLDAFATDDCFDVVRGLRGSVDFMAALRESVGPDIQIIFEAHTRLNPPQAIELCNAIEAYRPFYVEDPIRSENPASFAHLRAHTNVAIGTGEQLHDKWAFRELIERELVDYLRIDICHTGGITEGKKIAAMGEVHYQELACHYTASPVSTAAMLHLNLSVPNCAVQEFAPAGGSLDDVIQASWSLEDGYLNKPEAPGLGVDINEEAAAAHPPSFPDEPPHWRRPDGSVNDW